MRYLTARSFPDEALFATNPVTSLWGGDWRPGSFGIGLDGQRQDRWETRAVARNGHNVRIPITNGRTEMATEDLKARLETLAQTITQYQVRL